MIVSSFYSPSADQLAIATNGVERVEFGTREVVFNDGGANYDFRIEGDTNSSLFFVDASAEAVGIGTTSPSARLTIVDGVDTTFTGLPTNIGLVNTGALAAGLGAGINFGATYATGITTTYAVIAGCKENATSLNAAGYLAFGTRDSGGGTSIERARIDSSGRLLVGTSSAISTINYGGGDRTPRLQVVGDDVNNGSFAIIRTQTSPVLFFGGGTSGTNVASGNAIGSIVFTGYHTDKYYTGASIDVVVDGTPGTNDMPGRLVFSTTADGASSPTERMRITQDGRVLVTTTTGNPAFNNVQGGQFGALVEASNDDISGRFNRRTTDGNIIEFRQDGTLEGTISVSGSTVSYNGAHLSRWSQLPGGAEREEILRGTVLSNIDEMCDWGEEDNEQLNRMKVSDVEGDPNVSGVFQAWDDDDDTYTDDFYCAMTGDFIIRIAENVTVQRGDLLMSAGDGTAKPQDDDIIRSKTVAKVTSTHVTCTYEDGSYCVPCVLMAC